MTKRTAIITVIVGILALIVGGVIGFCIGYTQGVIKNINTYEECAAAGYPIQESYPQRCTMPGGKTFTKPVSQEESVTLEGKVTCLLPKNTDGPHTLECAAGLQADGGKYYSLKAPQGDTGIIGAAGSDRRVRVSGKLKEEASSKYQSEGMITVTDYEFIK